ncbi:spore germination protein [Paenibacillus sp. 1001270B_150601_E10]|uniref:spore germination protein n=1 Tax=Paenibacillus sp. 1001270B_150601_E10 TaxID=2787079 RepID=UPI003B6368D7
MRFTSRFRKQKTENKAISNSDHSGSSNQSELFSQDLGENLKFVMDSLGNSTDLITRKFILGAQGSEQCAAVLFIDGLADTTMIQDFIIRTLTSTDLIDNNQVDYDAKGLYMTIKNQAVSIAEINELTSFKDLLSSLLKGDTVILIDHCNLGIAAGTVGWEGRGVEAPEDQAVVRGPRDAFTENLRTNTALIRRKIKNPNLWLLTKTIGTVSQTNVSIMYINGIAEEQVVDEVNRRLDDIQINGILESGNIEELIEDRTLTPFPTMYNTERPDVIAAGLMEGRVAILVDGTPFVLLAPALFIHYFQAAEDYYQRADFGLLRLLRALCFTIALTGPSIYIAITTFHQEMLPAPLIFSIAAGREGVPFPAFIEALIMETTFEILREAGVRMPRAIGQTVSIVGALVIGQAAVEAGLISPGMVIVVAITAISSFALPSYSFGIAVRILRFPLMALAAAVGLYGIFIGIGLILIHLCSLKSFGMPYMSPFAPFNLEDQKDSLFRLPKVGLRMQSESIGKKFKRR